MVSCIKGFLPPDASIEAGRVLIGYPTTEIANGRIIPGKLDSGEVISDLEGGDALSPSPQRIIRQMIPPQPRL